MPNVITSLRLLSFRVAAADFEMVEQLEKMINSEKRIVDYTIKCVFDKIYLEWK